MQMKNGQHVQLQLKIKDIEEVVGSFLLSKLYHLDIDQWDFLLLIYLFKMLNHVIIMVFLDVKEDI